MQEITLTADQQAGVDNFVKYLTDPTDVAFVIEGYSGTGKSTLIKTVMDRLPSMMKTIKLINPAYIPLEVELTATTNKAAENFALITGMPVATIHSFLGLRVYTDHMTGESQLEVGRKGKDLISNKLIFIDEASYIDSHLLGLIFKRLRHCKVVFIGDPAQLVDFKTGKAPVFSAAFSTTKLEKTVRQPTEEGKPLHPITDLASKFRHAVNTGEFFSFTPDGYHVKHMDRAAFNEMVLEEFNRADWRHRDSKLLAWTNKHVVAYNHFINDAVKGTTDFQVGDYAVCNKFVSFRNHSIKTDQSVCITGISEEQYLHGVKGRVMTLDGRQNFFFPNSIEEKNARLKVARDGYEYSVASEINSEWIDLRAEFAQTVNKSQGSTYDRVFIDLDDIKKCNSGNQIARMLYVGVSRARHQVILTGDLV